MVSETHANGFRGRSQQTMAIDQSALPDVLEAVKAAEVDDWLRKAAETTCQALIETEWPGDRQRAVRTHQQPQCLAERVPAAGHLHYGRGLGVTDSRAVVRVGFASPLARPKRPSTSAGAPFARLITQYQTECPSVALSTRSGLTVLF
jgi:hypothetical protein